MAMRQLKIETQTTNRESRSAEKYLQDITKISLITPEEEVALAIKIKTGDQNALDKLARANLRFVVSVAKQYQHQGLSLSDLINEGNCGLIKAAKRFDETKGFKFISYAVWWIRQAILEGLAERGRLVRLPVSKQGTYNKANKAYIQLEQQYEREPSTEELAEVLEMSEMEINDIFQSNTRHTSLDAPVYEAEDITLGDLLTSPDPIHHLTDSNDLEKDVQLVLNNLPEIQRRVIILFFGIGCHAETLETIGEILNKGKERIRQIKDEAIEQLQKARYSRALKVYLG